LSTTAIVNCSEVLAAIALAKEKYNRLLDSSMEPVVPEDLLTTAAASRLRLFVRGITAIVDN